MATLVKTFSWTSDADSFTFTPVSNATGAWSSTGGDADAGCLSTDNSGRNKTDVGAWTRTLTFEDMGVPTGQTITGITSSTFKSKVTVWNVVNSLTIGTVTLSDGTTTVTLAASRGPTGTEGSYQTHNGSDNSSLSWASTQSVTITINHSANNANDAAAQTTWLGDTLSFTITYEAAQTTHTGTGSLAAGSASASGAGTLDHSGTGALASGSATASGAGQLQHLGSGALAAGSATASGTGTATGTAHTGTGALAAGSSSMSGVGWAGGTLFTVVYDEALAQPTAAQIIAGLDAVGSPAVFAANKAVSITGDETFNVTGLTPGASYQAAFVWSDGTDTSGVQETALFTTGSATVTGTGALAAGAASIAGVGQVVHSATGALAAGSASISGAGQVTHSGTGSLAAGVATIAGSGQVVHQGTGALAAGVATVTGAGQVVHQGTGALAAGAAAISGAGTLDHSGTGSLAAGSSTVSGAGQVTHNGTGALAAGASSIAGVGVRVQQGEVIGTGALSAGPASASGVGQLIHQGTGALSAGSATIAGAGTLSHQGTGALGAGDASVAGSGTLEHSGTGALASGSASIGGTGTATAKQTHTGTGALAAGAAAISGTNVIQAAGRFPGRRRRETEAYRKWRESLGKPDLSDLEVDEEIELEEAFTAETGELAFEAPQFIQFPAYTGTFYLDLPQRLPQVLIDLEAARTYRMAMEMARLAHLRREDEDLLLLLAIA